MRLAELMYRAALALLPEAFRRRHAAELRRLFRERVRDDRLSRGRRAAAARVGVELADVLVTAASQRIGRVRRAAPGSATRFHRRGGAPLVGPVVHDLRFAARALRRRPGYTAVAAVTLGVGMGAAAAIFAVTDAVLLRPLPFPQPERLVMAWRVVERYGFERAPSAYPDVLDWAEGVRGLERLSAFGFTGATLLGEGEPERLAGAGVTGDFFRTLGRPPELGRWIVPADDAPAAEPVVVLAHGLWVRRFGGDPGVVGRTVSLGGARATVVGVMPADFRFPAPEVDFWQPLRTDPATTSRDMHFLRVVGRLAPRVGLEDAEADLRRVADRVLAEHPAENEPDHLWLEPLHRHLAGDARPVLLVLSGAVALLLALACANLANLLLVRSSARGRELAVRAALGAGSRRVAGALWAESLLLALLGGALALILARGGLGALPLVAPALVPGGSVGVDGRVLAFALGLALLCALACGLAPALAAARRPPAATLREAAGATPGAPGRRLQGGLAVAQVALATILLTAAGVLGHSLQRLLSVPLGFVAEGVLTAHLSPPEARYTDPQRVGALYDALLERIAALPGVEAVGGTWALPFTPAYAGAAYAPEGSADPTEAGRVVTVVPVRGDYFRALGMTLLRGRGFSAADHADAPPVAVVNETLARAFWPGEDPLGKVLVDPEDPEDRATVVGVVADVKRAALDAEPELQAWLPQGQTPWARELYLTVRVAGPPMAVATALRRQVWALDPELPVARVATLSERVGESTTGARFRTGVFAVLAGTATLLSVVGIYGVLSFVVAQRAREMAVRLALGAGRRRVLAEVLGRGLRLSLAGLVLGGAGAVVATRFLRAFLFQVRPLDPLTFTVVPALLLVAAVAACSVPAKRAAGADPMRALRQE